MKRICVVGAGRWGTYHIKTLLSLNSLAAVVESDHKKLEAVSKLCPGIPIYHTLEESLEGNYQGYTVATPASTHVEIAKFLLERKKPVLVEKPMALSSGEARKLKILSQQQGVLLMVGHVLLFHPAIRKIKELLDGGKIGKLQYLYSNRLNLGTIRTEENILWSFAPHDISIFQCFLGKKPLEVVSRGGAFLQPHVQDSTMTILSYPDNVVAHIFVSWLHPYKEHRLILIGSKGMLSFEDSSEDKHILFHEKGVDWIQGEPIKRDGPTEIIDYQRSQPLTEELKYFSEHLACPSADVSGPESAIEVLEILERASDSLAPETKGTLPQAKPNPNYYVHPSSFIDENVEIGDGTKIWHFSHIQSDSRIGRGCSLGQNVNVANNVSVGNYVKIQNNVSIYEGVELEDYVFCGPSMVFTNIIDPRSKYPQCSSSDYLKTRVKTGASIGANATILCGITIGKHAFIAAGAVVTKDVADYSLVKGLPAKHESWICECGEILTEVHNETACKRCGLCYVLDGETLSQAAGAKC